MEEGLALVTEWRVNTNRFLRQLSRQPATFFLWLIEILYSSRSQREEVAVELQNCCTRIQGFSSVVRFQAKRSILATITKRCLSKCLSCSYHFSLTVYLCFSSVLFTSWFLHRPDLPCTPVFYLFIKPSHVTCVLPLSAFPSHLLISTSLFPVFFPFSSPTCVPPPVRHPLVCSPCPFV